MIFQELDVGDVFNTKQARWVKTDVARGMCIMSSLVPLGQYEKFNLNIEVEVLYSKKLPLYR